MLLPLSHRGTSVGFTALGKTLKRPPQMLVGSLRGATPILSSLSGLLNQQTTDFSPWPAQRM